MTFRVADICRNKLDAAGAMIEQVYIKVSGLYAVYRTDERVVIQFADDETQGGAQRKCLSELSVSRGAVDSLLDDIRHHRPRQKRARRYEHRLADALTLALQGQANQASTEVESLKQDLLEERKSDARLAYLATSLGVGAGLILLIALLSSSLFNFGIAGSRASVTTSMWFAAAIGTVGAFFSTVLAIRRREIEPRISTRDTIVDAGLRMVVGALSGVLIYVLIKAGAFGLSIGRAHIDDGQDFSSVGTRWLLVLLVAFVAGFLERLVPDMLAKASASEAKVVQPPLSSRSMAEDAAASERNPLGQTRNGETAAERVEGAPTSGGGSPTEDDPDRNVDNCCDRPNTPELLTQDVELPEALGGVEEAPARG